jgi:hypothetical protein
LSPTAEPSEHSIVSVNRLPSLRDDGRTSTISPIGLPHPLRRAGLPALLLALAVLVIHGRTLTLPLVGDDYVFVEKVAHATFAGLLAPARLLSDFYRPWSRELHFAWLHRCFGLDPLPYHLANVLLTLAALLLYATWIRRAAGVAAAATATAAVAVLEPWRLLDTWASGSQDLWMMVWALLALHAARSGRTLLAAGACALALLSKETAALLPVLLAADAVLLRRATARQALREVAPSLLVTLAWAALHPRLGGAHWYYHPALLVAPDATPLGLPSRMLRSLLAVIELDSRPAPESGWPAVAIAAALPTALVASFVWTAWPRTAGAPRAGRRLVAFGGVWAACGWAPLLLPTIGWHDYYALFGALGAWLALGTLLARRRLAALVLVPALTLLSFAVADTPSRDWGTVWFQARAARFTGRTRAQLLRLHPALPRGSRLFFTSVPAGIGLVPGGDDSPTLRTWYGDPTLRIAFLSHYAPRAAGDAAGVDRFFRYEETAGWVEIAEGPEDVAAARARNPDWRADHDVLAATLARAGEWGRAASEYAKLAGVEPARAEFAYDLALCLCSLGREAEARQWFERAVSLPGADAGMIADARRGCR